MPPDEHFRELLDRVGRDDEEAITELVQRYEPIIRTMVRAWLRPWELQLRRVFDSHDICQSVLAWFFLKNATQRYDLASPENLKSLLRMMVRNRVFYRVRQSKNIAQLLPMPIEIQGREQPPDEAVAEKELIDVVSQRLSPEEADLARRRFLGESWEQISNSLGGTPDGRRMQLSRAANRLTRELSLGE